jgi:hypothetical protein
MMERDILRRFGNSLGDRIKGGSLLGAAVLAAASAAFAPGEAEAQATCARTITADVVAFDQPLMWNRLGAHNINGMMYALRRDVVNTVSLLPESQGGVLAPGQVSLRPDKRPRPLVLRGAQGDCMEVTFQNLLTPVANPFNAVETRSNIDFVLDINNQVADRMAGINAMGVELVNSIDDDSSFVGNNANSLAAPGATKVYTWFLNAEGTFILSSDGAAFGGEGLAGNSGNGLFGSLNVAATPGTGFYRSQVSAEEMDLATTGMTGGGQPIINYEATYPNVEPWISEGKAGLPIINMVTPAGDLVHSDINAIGAYAPNWVLATPGFGPHANDLGHFPPTGYPLEYSGLRNPTVPNRLEPFRDFTVIFHDEMATKQAFPKWFEDPVWRHTLHGVRDAFMINYGSGGIGTEIISNRLGVGPMHDCVNCVYEEFFLTAFTVGDVGMLVDIPANTGLELCDPALNNCAAVGPKANYALFPDDPSNVHHSYPRDSVVFNNLHTGAEQHVFHLHNHQWLFNANDDNSNYLDAQGLGPGSGYRYWVNYGGAGNRNITTGDAIFHCHFYPHFAQGMWEMWRIHDVMETGTQLAAQAATVDDNADGIADRRASFIDDGLGIANGTPAAGARAARRRDRRRHADPGRGAPAGQADAGHAGRRRDGQAEPEHRGSARPDQPGDRPRPGASHGQPGRGPEPDREPRLSLLDRRHRAHRGSASADPAARHDHLGPGPGAQGFDQSALAASWLCRSRRHRRLGRRSAALYPQRLCGGCPFGHGGDAARHDQGGREGQADFLSRRGHGPRAGRHGLPGGAVQGHLPAGRLARGMR